MDKIGTIKDVTRPVMSSAAASVTRDILIQFIPMATLGLPTKVFYTIGVYAISGLVGTVVDNYIEHELDNIMTITKKAEAN